MEALRSYVRMKRGLCTDIARTYRKKSELFKRTGEEIKAIKWIALCPWFTRNVSMPFMNGTADYHLEKSKEFDKKAEDYERLANSGKVHFMPSIALCFILRELKDDIKPL